ncbi:rCG41264 [Rattus norvegicus]|uniref:RCG41264 n=1 Tax=Rattus norvegicus TaxID=10116 RepID=A6KNF9_RAT|nr:rCG41264 [Rattus norvegicus]
MGWIAPFSCPANAANKTLTAQGCASGPGRGQPHVIECTVFCTAFGFQA